MSSSPPGSTASRSYRASVVQDRGRVWITTREAFAIPGFGAPWVAGQLVALQAQMGTRAFNRALREGLRLRVEAEAALPLAA